MGVDTGNGYTLKEVWNDEYNAPASGGFQHSSPLNALFLSLDKDVPDVRLRVNIISTFDANGTLRVDIFIFESTCDLL